MTAPATSEARRITIVGAGLAGALLATLLAKRGWQVTGVDFAPRAIQLAKQKLRNANIQEDLQVKDATKLDGISGPFDFALDLGCFHGISRPGKAKYLNQLERILAPGGFWLMYGFFNSDPLQAGPWLSEADIGLIASQLTSVWRRDGFDDKRDRQSAWFLFQKR